MYNLYAMDRFSLLVVLAVLSCFTGCVPIPVGSEHPFGLVDQQTLDSLIGEDKSTILTSLGRPNFALVGEKSSYFIYGAYGDEYQLLLMVWVPVFGQKYPEGKLFCILIEFDEGNIFRRYEIERHSVIWSGVWSCIEKNISDCKSTFFSKEELESFSRGDTWNVRARLVKEVGIYCSNADLGHPDAQYHIGRLYHAGDLLKQDLVQSYVWYSLAANNGFELAAIELNKIKSVLSPVEIIEANKLLSTWQAGKCRENLLRAAPQGSE